MTGNMSYLTNFEEIDEGYVAFGGNPKGGKITGKGTIKTGNLDFKNVYFVKELQFNLFSVSQMCDKKNSVLFNDTECIVLSLNFKLTDESHVLLKVPRKNNMYSVDLKNIVPKGGLTCLFAKATSDESKLWHRRLGHINFKTMNKLVKGNLVRGLPSKLFENDQTCVACQKGKQHRASCKSKTVSSISQPLHMLHMDLFGPTFVKSLMKKMYCLVVTDDYSRFSWVFFLATKDETSGILKSFITGVENLIDQRVKVIRCDNGTEFKNKEMNQFCERKGIKREFSVARTPQQNGVAERKNRTLIEAARTMLADSKLPTTFWAEAVNTACYVQNRVLVTKPHNKTPYELFLGRKPALGFMRPFGCPVTILNTIDHLGKFDGKADEGFFVGYSINSKAFRVFNSRTRIVEENLHVQFSENTPNIAGSGPNWLFDIDALTKSMNYKPVVAGNQSNGNAGTKACDDAGKARMETVPGKDYILLPLWTADPPFSQSSKSSPDAGFKPSGDNEKKVTEEPGKEGGDSSNDQEKEDNVNNTNNVNTASTNEVNVVGAKTSIELPDDLNMPELEDIVYSDDDEDVGTEADMNNLNTFMLVSPILTTRIHKDHPVEQIIRDLNSAPQTRRMTKNLEEHGLFSSVQQRTNHKDFQNCLFACFLSQEEPKKVIHALKDPSWIEAMQDELLQFKLQKVWTLVDLPNGKRPIGTKWVYRNKKDERGIVIKNKAILVSQGYTQEEEIGYDEMDVNSAFLYGNIEEEVYVYQPLGFEDPDFPASTPMETQKPLIKCKKQTVVANSTTEAEYVAASSCCGQVLWIQNQLLDYGDSNEKKLIQMIKIHTDKNVADLLTKAFDVKTVNGEQQLQALVDVKKIVVTEASTTAWNKLSSTMASTIICLATNQKLNFSKYIFESMVKNLDNAGKFLMYPRRPKEKDTQVPQLNVADEDSMTLKELMDFCTKLKQRVLDLENTKTAQAQEITSLKKRVKKLEKKGGSRTHKLKRLYKVGRSARIVFSDEASLDDQEDASKQGRKIDDIDKDAEITLVDETQGRHDDDIMFDMSDLAGEEVFVAEQGVPDISAATITEDEITLAQALAQLKSKVTTATTTTTKEILLQEPNESLTTITTTISSKDKGKGIMVEEPLKMKKKDQISFDEQEAIRLQAEFDEEVRLAREKDEANVALIEEWNDIQAKINKRKKSHFAAKVREDQRNRTPTRAHKEIMCTYLKNMAGWKPKDLKNKSFANIQELFDKAFKRVNTFVDFKTELVEGTEMEESSKKVEVMEESSSKRAGSELEQENAKKQKVDDDQEATKLKELIKIVPDEEEVAVSDGSSKGYSAFIQMLRSFDREDLETLWKLVKAKHGYTRPEEGYERVLWGDLKTMFEHHAEDAVWRNLRENKVLV
ncbi:putative ribonuclease H-like domain-containing protein [Tanacetum coccineum]|uniref:Ribonuclease H-like domain-containing protein n=1 Tax=Tanacetum coccineum TaxID=301880 RepID=A0ABQ5E0L7_9ASTR